MTFVYTQKFHHEFDCRNYSYTNETPVTEIAFANRCSFKVKCSRNIDSYDVFLYIDAAEPVYADFECKINNFSGSFQDVLFNNQMNSRGWLEFAKSEKLLVNDRLVIDWTITLKSKPKLYDVDPTFSTEEQFSDFVLRCNGKEFKVHKAVLGYASTAFSTIFKNKPKTFTCIDIFDLDFATVDAGVKFIYKRELPLNANHENVMKLWDFVNKYNVYGKAFIENWLVYNINSKTVCLMANSAKKRNIKPVYGKCVDFLLANFNKISTFDNYKQFDGEIMKEVTGKKFPVRRKRRQTGF